MTDQPQEPYTRVPNALLDSMADLGNAELRVLLAITRKTTGFGKACDVISLTQLEKLTGIARPHLIAALESLLARNYIAREPAKRNGFSYQLVTLGNQLPKGTSNPTLPEPVTLGNQSLVTLGNTQKKEKETIKEKGSAARKRADTPATPNEIRTALADVCQVDMSVGTREQLLQVNQTAGALWRAGEKSGKTAAEVADAIRYVAGWFRKYDWRGKRGETPRPAQIREVWREAIAAKPKPVGTQPAEPVRKPRSRADVAAEARALAERAARGEL